MVRITFKYICLTNLVISSRTPYAVITDPSLGNPAPGNTATAIFLGSSKIEEQNAAATAALKGSLQTAIHIKIEYFSYIGISGKNWSFKPGNSGIFNEIYM